MSYEQKYLKYKQKYQELKKRLANINNLEVEESTDVQEFILTETPTFENQQTGGNLNISNDTDMYILSDTPNEEMTVQHDELSGGHNEQQDELKNELVKEDVELLGGNDDLVSTTDIEKIQNTEDIENLFNQLGGKKRRSRKSKDDDLDDLENLDSSDETSVTTSDSLTDISSDDI
jgi:hypothetical protein